MVAERVPLVERIEIALRSLDGEREGAAPDRQPELDSLLEGSDAQHGDGNAVRRGKHET